MEDYQKFDLNVITKGLLKQAEHFRFQADEYSFISRSSRGFNLGFDVDPIARSTTDASCTISLKNNELSVSIEILHIDDCPYFPHHFSTMIDETFPKLSGNDSDQFRMLIIPFRDMDRINNMTKFRMEFIFFDGKLDEIHFVIAQTDIETFMHYESILELSGEVV